MAENMIGGGALVTLEGATCASNIAAGSMVGVNTAANTIFSYSRETAGFSGTAGAFGMRFIGVLDDDVSAGQVSPAVWTEGVFRFRFQLGNSGGAALVGRPVYAASSGGGTLVSSFSGGAAGNPTGTWPVGTVVQYGVSGTAGDYIHVKINPGAFLWGGYAMIATTGLGNDYPPTL